MVQQLYLATVSSLSRLHDHTQEISHSVSGRVIRPKQRPLSHNTQHSQETAIHDPDEIRARNPSKPTGISLLLGSRHKGNERTELISAIIPPI
jgi:hypothetical protein